MQPTADQQRATVCYSGRVQGVGFRYTARAIAQGYDVTGIVSNLSDGRVELVVEGRPAEVNSFLAAVRDRFFNNIRDERRDMQPATGQFADFEIGH